MCVLLSKRGKPTRLSCTASPSKLSIRCHVNWRWAFTLRWQHTFRAEAASSSRQKADFATSSYA